MGEGNKKIIKAKITALSPLHIGTGRTEGTFHPCLDYIPARVLRGMLGNYLFNHENNHENEGLFKYLKINRDEETNIFFKPALPENKVAMPKLLKWCKKCGKLLISGECGECLQEGKSRSGFVSLKELIEDKQIKKEEENKSIITKCPIIRKTHTSPKPKEEEKTLSPYHIEAINKGARFDFWCVVKGNFNLQEHLVNAGLFYGAGGFISRGYGTILFEEFEEKTEEDYKKNLEKKFGLENKALMVLNSPAIFKGENDKYRIGFDEKWGNGRAAISETLARGWEVNCDKKDKEGISHIPELIPATAEGSCIEVDMDVEEQLNKMVEGIGEQKHIYGDVYFIPQKIYKKNGIHK